MDFNANNALIKHLKIDEGSPKYNRSFDYNILPFFTRQKERAKFKNGFMPVIGGMARYSLGLKIEYNQEDYDISNIYENVESVGNLNETQKNILLDRLFDFDKISSINHPRILTFQPLSDGSDKKGEVNIALYISKAFDLKNNLAWKNFINTTKSNNLMEKMFFDSIKQIDTKETKNNFVTLPDNLFTTRNEDLEFLLNHKDFALKNLDKFFAFYYFQYITQTVINIDNLNKIKNGVELEPLYFTLDSEKLSSTRITYKKGFNYIKERKKFTLANDNLIGYLNIIIKNLEGTSTFYSLTDILNFDENKIKTINHELSEMMKAYKMRLPKEEEVTDEFIDNLKILKKWLIKDLAEATSSRYSLSIDEIGDLYFLKSRGSLGKTLTIRKDILILLTSIIVKDEKKLIKEVFAEFEKRGVFFDRYTKEEVVNFYEKMNILDKKSDSGEVKYVKPVL
ncbi:DNA phosphorothioation-dependent restriction protein DptG [Staphylococcus petrasii]|uniref:DNA phosphorothioation-dependent restriction protein DptG n=3 Tax=Staphylococcus petrasii TaxID=1276936 RepID=A0A380FWC4_9STAP|nr:DNA phosphorothioation-dependent restriction protein DptG [Staphylococcus petrasii]TGE13775.1 DNA phosphorothioation-dependent restriction protein DptG [Staphylococcus petrasii]TGE16645.1 DNA phosphorothioation-dependent restriction protein DptG [Staphylococcus petrasii]SUM42812.1 DNA phosphorothioation-dependent restriction protein DptG [Staphylococcus petrasii]